MVGLEALYLINDDDDCDKPIAINLAACNSMGFPMDSHISNGISGRRTNIYEPWSYARQNMDS